MRDKDLRKFLGIEENVFGSLKRILPYPPVGELNKIIKYVDDREAEILKKAEKGELLLLEIIMRERKRSNELIKFLKLKYVEEHTTTTNVPPRFEKMRNTPTGSMSTGSMPTGSKLTKKAPNNKETQIK